MHHMRGGMGSGKAYTRPEEQHRGEEEEATNCLLVEGGIWEWSRQEKRRGEEVWCQVSASQID